jgi:hypothetical protein
MKAPEDAIDVAFFPLLPCHLQATRAWCFRPLPSSGNTGFAGTSSPLPVHLFTRAFGRARQSRA